MKMLWIFGYGSLMWKVDFPYEIQIVGYIKGYVRRFYQQSTDHRGTPEKPGRVVTLLPTKDPEAQVWGIAFGIHPDKAESVLQHLDFRERGGYTQKLCKFYPENNSEPTMDVLLYLATTANKNYGGEADVNTIVQEILTSVGPSGPNIDYVLSLANKMREIAPEVADEHLFAVEKGIKEHSQ